jgi:hypothetical protein
MGAPRLLWRQGMLAYNQVTAISLLGLSVRGVFAEQLGPVVQADKGRKC